MVTLVLAKTGLIFGLSRLFRCAQRRALRAGPRAGRLRRFGFVILAQAAGSRLVAPEVLQPVALAAMVLSMLNRTLRHRGGSEAIVRRWSATEMDEPARWQLHNIASIDGCDDTCSSALRPQRQNSRASLERERRAVNCAEQRLRNAFAEATAAVGAGGCSSMPRAAKWPCWRRVWRRTPWSS